MKILACAVFALILFGWVFSMCSCSGYSKPAEQCDVSVNWDTVNFDGMSPEQHLSIQDNNAYFNSTCPYVERLGRMLREVAEQYNEPVDSIANETSSAWFYLSKRRVTTTSLAILTDMAKVAPGKSYRKSIEEYIEEQVKLHPYNDSW